MCGDCGHSKNKEESSVETGSTLETFWAIIKKKKKSQRLTQPKVMNSLFCSLYSIYAPLY